MITRIEDYFAKGCGRCPRFATADCSTRLWIERTARIERLRDKIIAGKGATER